MGLHSARCSVRQLCHHMNVVEYDYSHINLDGVAYYSRCLSVTCGIWVGLYTVRVIHDCIMPLTFNCLEN